MKSTFIIAVLVATATVNAYQCPDTTAVNQACDSISVHPLVCNNPKVNVQECNAKQCNQAYIDNYSACQCVHSPSNFHEHSANVEGLLKRCGLADLKNPYGNPYQYRSGQGTQTFEPSSAGNGNSTSTRRVNDSARTVSAAPVVVTTSNYISGGAIAGIVLGTLAAAVLAGLLGWCWRKKRNEHTPIYSHSAYENRGPTRTVVTEKIEPVVVKSNINNATTSPSYGAAPAMPATGSTAYTPPTQPMPVAHNSTTYNTTAPMNTYSTTTDGYNTQPRTGGVVSGVTNAANDTANTGVSNAAHGTANAASNPAHGAATAVGNETNAAGNDVNYAANTAGNTFR